MDYRSKYLKYKNKYLCLKGGMKSIRYEILKNIIDETYYTYGNSVPTNLLNGSLFLESLGLIKIYNPETSIYTIVGHGCDEKDKLFTVPENCLYIHSTECGYLANTGIWDNFMCLFSENNKALKNPLDKINKDFLESKEIKYTFDKNGDTAVSNRFNLYYFPIYGICSGLYQIGSKIAYYNYPDEPDYCIKYSVDNSFISRYNINDDNINEFINDFTEFLINQYENSLFPTKEDIINSIEITNLKQKFKKEYLENKDKVDIKSITTSNYIKIFKEMIDLCFKTDIQTIFKFFPGIFYSISCRAQCDVIPPDIDHIKSEKIANQYAKQDFFRNRRDYSSSNLDEYFKQKI